MRTWPTSILNSTTTVLKKNFNNAYLKIVYINFSVLHHRFIAPKLPDLNTYALITLLLEKAFLKGSVVYLKVLGFVKGFYFFLHRRGFYSYGSDS